MRVVVTGGAGFIGSNLADALVAGDDVIVFDDLSSGKVSSASSMAQSGCDLGVIALFVHDRFEHAAHQLQGSRRQRRPAETQPR